MKTVSKWLLLFALLLASAPSYADTNETVMVAARWYSRQSPAWGVVTSNAPLFTVGQDSIPPNIDGTATSWAYNTTGDAFYDCGRFFGESWNWIQQGVWWGDGRAMVLKGIAARSYHNGGAAIFETRADEHSPGNHGVFNNWLFASTTGQLALGNLTDAADAAVPALNGSLHAWVTIYGDGSEFSRSKAPQHKDSQLPALCIQPQPLTKIAVPNAIENDGTNLFYTDNRGKRHKLLME